MRRATRVIAVVFSGNLKMENGPFRVHPLRFQNPDPPTWFDALKKFWADEGFDPSSQNLLLAVSGGCDSMAMLELFHRHVVPIFHCRLFAIHINHGLRPDADDDQYFVEQLCFEKNIPLEVKILDPSTRPVGQSMEMWGREHRYVAFERAQKKFGTQLTLTAHHRDDVVETFCLRMWRGTGFAGMAGISFRRTDEVVRPLLPVSRKDLSEWLITLDQTWKEDSSNTDVTVPRNWVRHHLLPQWRLQEPDVEDRIFHITREVAKLRPLWEKSLDAFYPREEVHIRGGIPMEWLEDENTDAACLRLLLPLLGVARPNPELISEIFRQTRNSRSIQVRVDENMILKGKQGVLIAKRIISASG